MLFRSNGSMKFMDANPSKKLYSTMDSSDSPTFGKQEGSAYNGHFGYIGKIVYVLRRKSCFVKV